MNQNNNNTTCQTDQRSSHQANRGFSVSLQKLKKQIAAHSALPLDFLLGQRHRETCGILMYHRMVPEIRGTEAATHNVSPNRFREQLTGLLAKGFQPIALHDLIERQLQNRKLPNKSFMVTFDDGYENFHTNAWPILQDLNIPVTLFMATGYLDSQKPFPFDDWSLAGSQLVEQESWRPLSTDQCRQMLKSDLFELGSHTHTHQDFRDDLLAFEHDMRLSYDTLQDRFHLSEAPFSFPWGNIAAGYVTPSMIQVVRSCGATCGLTTESQFILQGSYPFTWGRFTAADIDTATTLASKLSGWYSTLRTALLRIKEFPFSEGSRLLREDKNNRQSI